MMFGFLRKKTVLQKLHTDICKKIDEPIVRALFENNTWITEVKLNEEGGVLVLNHYTVYPNPDTQHYKKAVKQFFGKDIVVKTNMYYE